MIATPALAHHPVSTAVGSGGGMNVAAPDTLDKGRWYIGGRSTFSRPDQRSDEQLAALAGRHVHAHNTDYNLTTAVGASYGLTSNLTVSADLSYIRRDDMREGHHSHQAGVAVNEVEYAGSISGIGDLNLLATYRLAQSETAAFAIIGGIKAPTGSTHKRNRDGERFETEHQLGTGSWDPIIGAAGRLSLGAVNLDASGSYQFSGKGAQDTHLGDRALIGIALSHRFGPPAHDDSEHHDGAEHEPGDHDHPATHSHASWDVFVEVTGEWEGKQMVAGEIEDDSGGKSLWLSPGARYNAASGFSIGGSLGLPVAQRIRESHPDNSFRFTLAVGKAF